MKPIGGNSCARVAPERGSRWTGALISAAAFAMSLPMQPAAVQTVWAADLTQTIEQVKPAVVAIGTFVGSRSPSVQFNGTGFAVADGRYVVTNAHTVSSPLNLA